MKIRHDQMLRVEFVAKLWAAELKGTPLEERVERLLFQMELSFADGRLKIADDCDGQLKGNMLKLLRRAAKVGSSSLEAGEGLILRGCFYALKVARHEFLPWAVGKMGYPPPKFWDGEDAAAVPASQTMAVPANTDIPPSPTEPSTAPKRQRGNRRSKVSLDAEAQLERAIHENPDLLAALEKISDKALAKICGLSHETDRHHIRTVRAEVLKKYRS